MTEIARIVADAKERLEALGAAPPRAAIILGSGLGPLAGSLEDAVGLDASEIPGYPASTVEGHDGRFLLGKLEGVPVAVLKGRIHGYEGHPGPVLALPARILLSLGAQSLVVTNAAGGIDPGFAAGDLMLISDHLNLGGKSPLEGANVAAWGPRFPDMSAVYPAALRERARTAAAELGIGLREGVYAMMPGPQYETPAEVRMLGTLGAAAVGMSTVPEAIVASHMGIPVLGISLISNLAAGIQEHPLSHQEVLDAAEASGQDLQRLVRRLLATGAL